MIRVVSFCFKGFWCFFYLIFLMNAWVLVVIFVEFCGQNTHIDSCSHTQKGIQNRKSGTPTFLISTPF